MIIRSPAVLLAAVLLAPALLAAPRSASGQSRPVHFTLTARTGGRDTLTAVLTARIDRGWHMYSLTQPPGGPVPLALQVHPPFRVAGHITAPPPHIGFDGAFGIALEQYSDSATFVLPLVVTGRAPAPLHVTVRYQVCDGHVCLRPTTVNVPAAQAPSVAR